MAIHKNIKFTFINSILCCVFALNDQDRLRRYFSFSCRVQILEDGQVLQINYVTPSEQLHISFFFKKN